MAWGARTIGVAVGALAISTAGVATGIPTDSAERESTNLLRLTILNINDFHGQIEGSAPLDFACTLQREKKKSGEGNYLFLSAGDNIGGSPTVSSSQMDNPTIDFLNALELEATAVGNHEFNRGFSDLRGRVIPRANFANLGANVYIKGTDQSALDEFHITEIRGVSVAVIGAVTRGTPSLVNRAGIGDLEFGDPVAAVNRVAQRLSDGDPANGEADIIIAQYHDGASAGWSGSSLETQIAQGGVFARIVNETTSAVDAIFTGHTHKVYAWDGATDTGTRPIIQAGAKGTRLGKVVLGVDPESMTVKEYTRGVVLTSPHSDVCDSDEVYQAAKAIVDTAASGSTPPGTGPDPEPAPTGTVTFIGTSHSIPGSKKFKAADVPANVEVGDALLMWLSAPSSVNWSAPSGVTGWTEVKSATLGTTKTTLWAKSAGGTDAGKTVRVDDSTGYRIGTLALAAYRNVDLKSLVAEVAGSMGTAHHTSPPAATRAGDWVVSYWADRSGNGTQWTVPGPSVTRGYSPTSPGYLFSSVIADSDGPVPTGPAGSLAATSGTVSDASVAWTVVLRPQVDSGAAPSSDSK